MKPEEWRERLRPVFEGRKWILLGGAAAGLRPLALELMGLGARRPFLLVGTLGTGELPTKDEAEVYCLDVAAKTMVEGLTRFEEAAGALTTEAQAAIDRWDPRREARALGSIVLAPLPEIGGRRRYAARPASWAALEDKVRIDAFWDAVGLPRPPGEVVPATPEDVAEAAKRLGGRVAIAGDARAGLSGGAERLRIAADPTQARAAAESLAPQCDRVRVSRYLNGVPCSAHGIVFESEVLVGPPVEALSLRREGADRIVYAGVSTYWQPPDRESEAVRSFVRRAGEGLREHLDFRGTFTVDGVLGEHGFLPTEMNPRVGGAMSLLEAALDGVPLILLALAAQEREPVDFAPKELEARLLKSVRDRPAANAIAMLGRELSETVTHDLAHGDGVWRLAAEGESAAGKLLLGPGISGGFLKFKPVPGAIEPGPPFASHAAQVFALADAEFDTGIGRLVPAAD